MAFEGLKNLKDLLGVTAAYARLDAAMVKELEDAIRRIYALEQQAKTDKFTRQDLMTRVGKLELMVRQKAVSE